MKRVRYEGPGDVFDARPIPGFGDDKFIFYSPNARHDADGQPVAPEQRGNVVTVTNAQWTELYTYGGARFVEVEQPAAPATSTPDSPAEEG